MTVDQAASDHAEKKLQGVVRVELASHTLRTFLMDEFTAGASWQRENGDVEKLLEIAIDALEFTNEMCLCRRFQTMGFDYSETHRKAGKAGIGKRFITPQDKVRMALDAIRKIQPPKLVTNDEVNK